MEQISKQYSLNLPLDDPRVRRIQELGANRTKNSKEEEEELLQLILALKKGLPVEQPETAMLHSLISVPKDAPQMQRLIELFSVVGRGVATEPERAEWWKLLTELTEKQMPQLSEENRRLAEEQLRLLEPLAKGK